MYKKEFLHNLQNVKLVIGNGFDLHCKADSSYKSFFEYLFGNDDSMKKHVDEFPYDKSQSLFSSKNNIKDYWDGYKFFAKRSAWDFYFYILSKNSNENSLVNWSDVESAIKKSLEAKVRTKELFWENIFNILGENEATRSSHSKSVTILSSVCYVKNGCKKFKIREDFYSFLLNELKKFEKVFGKFIEEDHYYENKNFGMKFRKDRLFAHLSNITINELCSAENVTSIDSFNFGPVGDEKFEKILININGNLSNPIFGIDSNSFEPYEPAYIFTKINRRMELDCLDDEINIDKDFKNIIVYGHSLNEADYNYFFSLFDTIDLINVNIDSKIIFAYSIYDVELEQQIKSDLRLRISQLFLNYAKYKGYNDPCRLLDFLTFIKKVFMFEINDFGKSYTAERREKKNYLLI